MFATWAELRFLSILLSMSTNVNFRRDNIAAHDSLLLWAVLILRSVSCNSVSHRIIYLTPRSFFRYSQFILKPYNN